MLLITALWLKEEVSLLQTMSLLFLLAISVKTQVPLLTRAVWICINTTLCHLVFPHHSHWTQTDYFACAFPGFMCSKAPT